MNSFLTKPDICNVPDLKSTFVYKDECIYCFNTPEHFDGLYICMKTFIGVCRKHLDLFFKKSQNELYLNIKIERRIKLDNEGDAAPDESEYKKLLKEAFNYNKTENREYQKLVRMPYEEIKVDEMLPDKIQNSITNIMAADSVLKACERATKAESFDPNNYIAESKYASTLKQLDNGVKIPPNGWKCCKCDLTTNLWLNLTDGSILCGRKFFDGSGGNNHAIDHYNVSGFPLAVKLGTITPETADVFSYPEDDMVRDSNLAAHLAHFGIDIMKLKKTDKTMEELQMENIKQSRERIAIMESESNLELLHGPELTGISNTGNSCYMNSVLQVMFTVPSFNAFYSDRYFKIVENCSVEDAVKDFRLQLSKVGYYMRSGNYSFLMKEMENKDGELVKPSPGITPNIFRVVVGQNHVEFSTKQQQDVNEFLIHLFNLIQKDIKKNKCEDVPNPLQSFCFKVEERIFCKTSQTVSYKSHSENVLSLPIPIHEAINKDELAKVTNNSSDENETVRPIVKLEQCLKVFIDENLIEGYINSKGVNSVAFLTTKLETFPDYLWIQLKRFCVGSDWMPKKLDVEVEIPDLLNLADMKAGGLQPGEVEMVDSNATGSSINTGSSAVVIDPDILANLTAMGFSENACKKAIYYTNNASLEEAANWLMIHVGENDFDELPAELRNVALGTAGNQQAASNKPPPNESDIAMMTSMGFTRQQAIKALNETNNLERAADWAFNHMDELQNLPEEMDTGEPKETNTGTDENEFVYSNGAPRYELSAIISHMGSNTHVGHYVAHVKRSDQSWVLFNDEKVQRSINPPKKFAYMCLYRRCK